MITRARKPRRDHSRVIGHGGLTSGGVIGRAVDERTDGIGHHLLGRKGASCGRRRGASSQTPAMTAILIRISAHPTRRMAKATLLATAVMITKIERIAR